MFVSAEDDFCLVYICTVETCEVDKMMAISELRFYHQFPVYDSAGYGIRARSSGHVRVTV